MQALFEDGFHGRIFDLAFDPADHKIELFPGLFVAITFEPVEITVQTDDGVDDRPGKILVEDDQLYDIAGVEAGAIRLEIKLIAGYGQQQVFPIGRIRIGEIILQVTKFYIQNICRLDAPFDILADIDKSITFSTGHRNVHDAIVKKPLTDEDIQRRNGVLFVQDTDQ